MDGPHSEEASELRDGTPIWIWIAIAAGAMVPVVVLSMIFLRPAADEPKPDVVPRVQIAAADRASSAGKTPDNRGNSTIALPDSVESSEVPVLPTAVEALGEQPMSPPAAPETEPTGPPVVDADDSRVVEEPKAQIPEHPVKPSPTWQTDFEQFTNRLKTAALRGESLEGLFSHRQIDWTVTFKSFQSRNSYLSFVEAESLREGTPKFLVDVHLAPSAANEASKLRPGTKIRIRGAIGFVVYVSHGRTFASGAGASGDAVMIGPHNATIVPLDAPVLVPKETASNAGGNPVSPVASTGGAHHRDAAQHGPGATLIGVWEAVLPVRQPPGSTPVRLSVVFRFKSNGDAEIALHANGEQGLARSARWEAVGDNEFVLLTEPGPSAATNSKQARSSIRLINDNTIEVNDGMGQPGYSQLLTARRIGQIDDSEATASTQREHGLASRANDRRGNPPTTTTREPVESSVDPPSTPKAAVGKRSWESADGQSRIYANFLAQQGNSVTIRKKDGKTIDVPVDSLSEFDRSWLKLAHAVRFGKSRGTMNSSRFQKAYALLNGRDRNYQQSLVLLEQNIKESPSATDIDYAFGWAAVCCARMGEYEKACLYYEIVNVFFPGDQRSGAGGAIRNWNDRLDEVESVFQETTDDEATQLRWRVHR